jgi:hypothetical protein
VGQVEWARTLARRLLEEPLPQRWAHTQGVASRAERLVSVTGQEADLLVSAAWLHDIGYSQDLAATGFHPLDGARYLRDVEHRDARLCCLVAHHTCAVFEAEERGLAGELLREFPRQREELTDALIYCDMTTGPDGRHLPAEERLSEIYRRYGADHIVSRSIARAAPTLAIAVGAVEERERSRA